MLVSSWNAASEWIRVAVNFIVILLMGQVPPPPPPAIKVGKCGHCGVVARGKKCPHCGAPLE